MSAAMDTDREAVVAIYQGQIIADDVATLREVGHERMEVALSLETWGTICRALKHYGEVLAGGVPVDELQRRVIERGAA